MPSSCIEPGQTAFGVTDPRTIVVADGDARRRSGESVLAAVATIHVFVRPIPREHAAPRRDPDDPRLRRDGDCSHGAMRHERRPALERRRRARAPRSPDRSRSSRDTRRSRRARDPPPRPWIGHEPSALRSDATSACERRELRCLLGSCRRDELLPVRATVVGRPGVRPALPDRQDVAIPRFGGGDLGTEMLGVGSRARRATRERERCGIPATRPGCATRTAATRAVPAPRLTGGRRRRRCCSPGRRRPRSSDHANCHRLTSFLSVRRSAVCARDGRSSGAV